MTNAANCVESVRAGLEMYLELNPGACDTIDGMVSWWLGGMWLPGHDRIDMCMVVQVAVAQLIAEGRLRCLALHATEPYYMDSVAESVPLELLLAKAF
jgi:hypothetical protein